YEEEEEEEEGSSEEEEFQEGGDEKIIHLQRHPANRLPVRTAGGQAQVKQLPLPTSITDSSLLTSDHVSLANQQQRKEHGTGAVGMPMTRAKGKSIEGDMGYDGSHAVGQSAVDTVPTTSIPKNSRFLSDHASMSKTQSSHASIGIGFGAGGADTRAVHGRLHPSTIQAHKDPYLVSTGIPASLKPLMSHAGIDIGSSPVEPPYSKKRRKRKKKTQEQDFINMRNLKTQEECVLYEDHGQWINGSYADVLGCVGGVAITPTVAAQGAVEGSGYDSADKDIEGSTSKSKDSSGIPIPKRGSTYYVVDDSALVLLTSTDGSSEISDGDGSSDQREDFISSDGDEMEYVHLPLGPSSSAFHNGTNNDNANVMFKHGQTDGDSKHQQSYTGPIGHGFSALGTSSTGTLGQPPSSRSTTLPSTNSGSLHGVFEPDSGGTTSNSHATNTASHSSPGISTPIDDVDRAEGMQDEKEEDAALIGRSSSTVRELLEATKNGLMMSNGKIRLGEVKEVLEEAEEDDARRSDKRMRRDMMERGNIQRRHGRREEKEGENEGDGITRTMIVDGDKKRSDSETESGSYTEESGSGSGNNNVDGATLVINSGFPMKKKKKRRKKKIKIQPKFKYHGADLIKKKPKFSSLRQYSKDE
ncbi:hypothetical protein ADUPG1_000385, partial [Aduncisulcus paluster]